MPLLRTRRARRPEALGVTPYRGRYLGGVGGGKRGGRLWALWIWRPVCIEMLWLRDGCQRVCVECVDVPATAAQQPADLSVLYLWSHSKDGRPVSFWATIHAHTTSDGQTSVLSHSAQTCIVSAHHTLSLASVEIDSREKRDRVAVSEVQVRGNERERTRNPHTIITHTTRGRHTDTQRHNMYMYMCLSTHDHTGRDAHHRPGLRAALGTRLGTAWSTWSAVSDLTHPELLEHLECGQ